MDPPRCLFWCLSRYGPYLDELEEYLFEGHWLGLASTFVAFNDIPGSMKAGVSLLSDHSCTYRESTVRPLTELKMWRFRSPLGAGRACLFKSRICDRTCCGRDVTVEVLSRDFRKQSRFASGADGTSVQSLVPLFQLLGRVWRLLAIDKPVRNLSSVSCFGRLSACEGARIADIRLANSVWR